MSLGLSNHYPKGVEGVFLLPPVYGESPALRNFLLIAIILGPVGWIMAQGLDWFNSWIDSGTQTCGLDFIYENDKDKDNVAEEKEDKNDAEEEKREEKYTEEKKEEEGKDSEEKKEEEADIKEENEEEEDGEEENEKEELLEEDRNRTMCENILSVLFKKEVAFMSTTGR